MKCFTEILRNLATYDVEIADDEKESELIRISRTPFHLLP